jgi:hypothetical protein
MIWVKSGLQSDLSKSDLAAALPNRGAAFDAGLLRLATPKANQLAWELFIQEP